MTDARSLVDVRSSCADLAADVPVPPLEWWESAAPKEPSRSRLRRLRDGVAGILEECSPRGDGVQFRDQVWGRWYPVTACGKVPSAHVRSLLLTQRASGRIDASGILRCGSVWHCPECMQRIAFQRGKEIREAVEAARAAGLAIFMVSRTVPHTIDDPCALVLERLNGSLAELAREWTNRQVLESSGFVGRVRVKECTYGIASGWHWHSHDYEFFRLPPGMTDGTAEGDQDAARMINAAVDVPWRKSVYKASGGLVTSSVAGVDVRPVWSNSDYPIKMPAAAIARGDKARWAEAELSATHMKLGRANSRAVLELIESGIKDQLDADLVREFCAASWGHRQIEWTRNRKAKGVLVPGIRELLGLRRDVEDKEAAVTDPDMVFVDELVPDGDQSEMPVHVVEIDASDAWRARASTVRDHRRSIDLAVRDAEMADMAIPDALASRGWEVEMTSAGGYRTELVEIDGVWQENHTFDPKRWKASWPLKGGMDTTTDSAMINTSEVEQASDTK